MKLIVIISYINGLKNTNGLYALASEVIKLINDNQDIVLKALEQTNRLRGLGHLPGKKESEKKVQSFDEVVKRYNQGIVAGNVPILKEYKRIRAYYESSRTRLLNDMYRWITRMEREWYILNPPTDEKLKEFESKQREAIKKDIELFG